MKKALIIDDEPLARSVIKQYLTGEKDISVAGEAGDGFEGVKLIAQESPDLIFLDVQMPRISGFEMLELVEDRPAVIFTTAFDEYAIRAFEASAIDYLLKPFSRERFASALEKWRRQSVPILPEGALRELASAGEQGRIVVKRNAEILIVPVDDVHYIEAYDDYVKIFTSDDFFLKKRTMNHFEATLDPAAFFRIHRSFIINLTELSKIEPMEKNAYVAILRSGKRLPLSRTAYVKLKEKLAW